MADYPDVIQFTIGITDLIGILLNDPDCRAEVREAIIKYGKNGFDPRNICGAANLGSMDNPDWFNLFVSTDKNKEVGKSGCILRNRQRTRIGMRLRRQSRKSMEEKQAELNRQLREEFPEI